MAFINLKKETKMRVRSTEMPLFNFPVSGVGIDVTMCRTGHFACPACDKPFWDVTCDKENHKVLIACRECGWETKLIFPIGTDYQNLPKGEPNCYRHPKGAWAIIKCDETVCIGCQNCATEFKVEIPLGTPLIV